MLKCVRSSLWTHLDPGHGSKRRGTMSWTVPAAGLWRHAMLTRGRREKTALHMTVFMSVYPLH